MRNKKDLWGQLGQSYDLLADLLAVLSASAQSFPGSLFRETIGFSFFFLVPLGEGLGFDRFACVDVWDDEVEVLLRFAKEIQIRLHRTEVVAQMQLAGRLDTREDAHGIRVLE